MGRERGPADVGPAGQHPRGDRPTGRAPGRADARRAVAGRGHRPRLRCRRARAGRRARRGHASSTLCDRAVAAALLTEADGPGRYTFAHALIEHALYDGLSAGRRGRIHRTVAEALEAICGDDPGERDRASSPTTGRAPPSPRTQARRSRTRNGRAIGPWRSSRPTRRCAGTEMRSICWTGPPPTTRAVGPRCSSGSATRNGRRVIPRTARRCSRRAASPTTSTRSTSSCARCCGTTEDGCSIAGGIDRERIEMLELALTRLGDCGQPRPSTPAGAAVRREHLGRRVRRAPGDGRSSRRHRAAHRRRRRAGRRDPALPRGDQRCPRPSSSAGSMEPRGVRPRRRLSATRPPACTPTTTCTWRRLEAGDVADHAGPHA